MPVEIENDSLCLSGETGTKLKTEIIERYYRFWLSVTTRGKGRFADYVYIIEMNAGTGQIKIEETGKIILGSAGHVLDLKYGPNRHLNKKLRVVLVEPHKDCRQSLQNVILNRWPEAQLHPYKQGWERSSDGSVSLLESSEYFLKHMNLTGLGNSLFFFDPLLAPDQSLVEKIASTRINTPFKIGTEFMIFFFTSDWVRGRTEFSALPKSKIETEWTLEEKESARTADRVFGNQNWVGIISNGRKQEEMERELVGLYKQSLRRWFRFVQPLPFVPKGGQRYDVFCCSNFDVGMTVINRIYGNLTWPFGLQGDIRKNRMAYTKFIQLHPELDEGLSATERPPEWKVLWYIMRNHIDGICDPQCKGEITKKLDSHTLNGVLTWLYEEGYIKQIGIESWPWVDSQQFPVFTIDWTTVKTRLDVDSPAPPRALEPGDLDKVRVQPQKEDEQEDEDQTSLTDFF